MATKAEEQRIDELNKEHERLVKELMVLDKDERQDEEKKKAEKKKAKRKSSTSELFKLFALALGVTMFAAFVIQDSASIDIAPAEDTFVRPNTSQHSFVARYTAYEDQVSKLSSTGGTTKVDLSDAYVDAAGVVPAFSSSAVVMKEDIHIGVKSPTRETNANSFVVNVEKLVTAQMQDIINVEKSYSGLEYEDASVYARRYLTGSSVWGSRGGSSGASCVGKPLTASLPIALLVRDYYTEEKFLGADMNKGFWSNIGTEVHSPTNSSTYTNAPVDLMFVSQTDVDDYYAGEDVPVLYVECYVCDAKAHNAPWCLNQTMVSNSGGKLRPIIDIATESTAYEVDTSGLGSAEDMWRAVVEAGINQSNTTYFLPYLEKNVIPNNLAWGPMWSRQTWSMFERYMNNAGRNVYSVLQSLGDGEGPVLVGVLVYTPGD